MAIKAGSISGAAAKLDIAQTALSIQVRDLEREVGVKLLERHSRGVVPTAAGRRLFERSNEIERLLETTLAEVRAIGAAGEGRVVVGLSPSHMRHVGADILVAARTLMPGMSLQLVEELSFGLVEAIERDELDVAIAYDVPDRPGLARTAVIEDELLFVTAPGAAVGVGPISFAEAVGHELYFAGDRGIVALVRRTAERLSLTPRIVAEMQSVQAIRAKIADGAASLLPFGQVADGIEAGTFVVRPVIEPVLTRTLYIVHRAERSSPFSEPLLGTFIADVVRRIAAASAPHTRLLDPHFADGAGEAIAAAKN